MSTTSAQLPTISTPVPVAGPCETATYYEVVVTYRLMPLRYRLHNEYLYGIDCQGAFAGSAPIWHGTNLDATSLDLPAETIAALRELWQSLFAGNPAAPFVKSGVAAAIAVDQAAVAMAAYAPVISQLPALAAPADEIDIDKIIDPRDRSVVIDFRRSATSAAAAGYTPESLALAVRIQQLSDDYLAARSAGQHVTASALRTEALCLIEQALERNLPLAPLTSRPPTPAPLAERAVSQTLPSYRKEIVYDRETRDYAMYLSGELVGFARTYHAAEVTLDQLVFELLKGGEHNKAGSFNP